MLPCFRRMVQRPLTRLRELIYRLLCSRQVHRSRMQHLIPCFCNPVQRLAARRRRFADAGLANLSNCLQSLFSRNCRSL
jgi:hypothetical protein